MSDIKKEQQQTTSNLTHSRAIMQKTAHPKNLKTFSSNRSDYMNSILADLLLYSNVRTDVEVKNALLNSQIPGNDFHCLNFNKKRTKNQAE